MTEGFSLTIRNHQDRTEICCAGVLDVLPAEKLREALSTALERDLGTVVLDCSGITLLTSAGISALVDAGVEARQADQVLHFTFGPHVRRILDLVGLWWLGVIDDGVAVHESLQRALRSFAEHSYEGKVPRKEDVSPTIEQEGT
ncbi:MAG: STAS domain-containing protein [Actinomycetota bacterium]